MLLAVISAIINQMTPIAEMKRSANSAIPVPLRNSFDWDLAPPIIVAAMGYGLMNLLMIQASLQMAAMHTHFQVIGVAVQWHVFAMFAPSFITGYLIARMGVNRMVLLGLVLLATSAMINFLYLSQASILIALVVLGVGWNFTYVAGGAMLALRLEGNRETIKVQGVNDLVIAVMATAGAFLPGLLLAMVGWSGTNAGVAMLMLALIAYFITAIRRTAAKKQVVK